MITDTDTVALVLSRPVWRLERTGACDGAPGRTDPSRPIYRLVVKLSGCHCFAKSEFNQVHLETGKCFVCTVHHPLDAHLLR